MTVREIYLASDHAGFAMKMALAEELRDWGHSVHDLGPQNAERVDYPDYARQLADAMKPVDDALGVLVCGSGIGIAMMANRYSWMLMRKAMITSVIAVVLWFGVDWMIDSGVFSFREMVAKEK